MPASFRLSRWPLLLGLLCAPALRAQEGEPTEVIQLEGILSNLRAAANEAGGREQSTFWIGISCHSTDKGVVVDHVVPEGPAARAGVNLEDMIISVGDHPVRSPEQIADVLARSQGRGLRLGVIRGGRQLALEVHPARQAEAKRVIVIEEKKEEKREREPRPPEHADPRPSEPSARPRIQIVPGQPVPPPGMAPVPARPGMATGSMPGGPAMGWQPMTPLPEDMQVTIAKKGASPAVVTCKQGNKLWKTTENELDMLPQPARNYAAHALGKNVPLSAAQAWLYNAPPGGMPNPAAGGPNPEPKRMELRLDGAQFKIDGNPVPPGPNLKVLPGGGIQIEIHERDEKKR